MRANPAPLLRWVCTALAMLSPLFGTGSAQAHPHNWIDVYMEWQFDDQGQITGVEMRWHFDDYYSVMLVEDAAKSGKTLPQVLHTILGNIGQHHYFLNIDHRGAEVSFGKPHSSRIGVQDHRIEIAFSLPFNTPLAPKQHDVVYQIAEPTYFFEVLHAEEGPAIVLKDAPANCQYGLKEASPDAALVTYAAALGIDETGGDDLGIQFAETVTIRCG